ncbi:MAG TPA: glycosyltransferase family 2 protein [Candidatus Magasanikbacteria bacterium]|nr:glycosyltransferase family 2 protein [Candidatus Magasanikbacteria bacterium]
MSKLAVNLVTWNGAKYLPYLFDSLRKQTFFDWELQILDNNSTDNTVEVIEKEITNFPVPVKFFKEKENHGFAKGHNILFRENETEYFLLLNQDMYLENTVLEKMVDFLDKNSTVAGVSPRLMRWNFCEMEKGLQATFSSMVDALGLKVFRNRRVIEQYTGENWEEIKSNFGNNNVLEVFGVSGAFPMYRREAIKNVLFSNGQVLDESYHSYKEDVDLAWRLRLAGYSSFVMLNIVAYHDRAGAGPKEKNDWAAMQNKKKHSPWVKYYSYRNHLMTLYKNEDSKNFWLDFIFIAWYELKKLVYFAIFDLKILKGLGDVWLMRKDLRNKRKEIKKIRKTSSKDLRKWWK